MPKKTLAILLSVGIILGIFTIFYFIFTGTKTPQDSNQNNNPVLAPTFYIISINYYNQSVTGELIANGTTTNLSNLDSINHYGLISFNSAKDIMWFGCSQGYTIKDFSSATGNKTDKIDSLVNIEITNFSPEINNNLIVTCNKITQ